MSEDQTVDETVSEERAEQQLDDDDEAAVDLRQSPEYKRARGSIFMVAFLFYGLLGFMCVVVAIVVVILLTRG